MDSKAFPSHLDPKLKEAYDRVMGTASSTSAPPQQNQKPTPQQPPQKPALPTPPAQQASSIGSAIFGTAPPLPQSPIQPIQPSKDSVVSPTSPLQQPTSSYAVPFVGTSMQQPGVINSQTMATSTVSQVKPHAPLHPVKKSMEAKPVVVGILGIIFLIIYAFVWVEVFNVQLPFQLPFR